MAKKTTKKSTSTKKLAEKKEQPESTYVVLCGQTRIKALAILNTLKKHANGLSGRDLRLQCKFPCIRSVINQLMAKGLVCQYDIEDVKGISFAVTNLQGKLNLKVKKELQKATSQELKEASKGHKDRNKLATWQGFQNRAKKK